MARYEDIRGTEQWLLAATGRAWVFGDRISQPQLLASDHLHDTPAVAKDHALAGLDPRFAARVTTGDVIVAGLEFGADVRHRAIPLVLKTLGIAAVVARSFGPIFLRDAINSGLPALVVEETGAIKTGDRLRVDIEAHIIANLSSGDRYVIRNINDDELAILRAGGIVEPTRGPD